MVYRGSPEEWDWDGSFGSETNPKPGGEQSKWIKENAQSGGGRNEEYYGKIEDDNRSAHLQIFKFLSYVKVDIKVGKILKGSLDSIPSPSPSVKIQIMGGKVCWSCKGKTLLDVVNKHLKTKSLLTSPSNVLPYYLK